MTSATATKNAADSATPKKALAITGGLLLAGVLIAIIIAFAAGGDDESSASAAASGSRIPQGEARQVSFAEVTGDSLPRFESAVVDEAIGMAAPAITASYFDNEEVVIEPGDGTAKVILFVAHWCPHCQAEVAELTEWAANNTAPADIDIITVSTSVDQGAPNYPPSSWLLRENWPFPTVRDSAQGDLAAGYGLSSFPYLVAIDADGTVVTRSGGQLQTGQWDNILTSLSTSSVSG